MKMKLRGERQMSTAEEEGGREGRRHMQRRGWEVKGGGEFARKGKIEGGRYVKIKMEGSE